MTASSLSSGTELRIHPFRAVRFDPAIAGDLSNVVCPPYDDLRPAHAQALRRRPHHLARLLYERDPYSAAEQMSRWWDRGVVRRDERPALYVYQQQLGARILQRGLLGELEVDGTDSVLPHEGVQEHAVRQHAAHMAALQAQLEPLLLTYRPSESTAAQVVERVVRRPPVASARTGIVTHTLWACTAPDEQELIQAGLSRCQALLADGHHRHAACMRLGSEEGSGPWKRQLALLVDSAAHPLELAAIHRVLPGLDVDKAAAAAADVACVRPWSRGLQEPWPGELLLTGGGKAWGVTDPEPEALADALTGRPQQWHSLPAAVSDHLLMSHAWSVADLPGAVQYVHSVSEAVAAVSAPGSGTAVLLPPVTEDRVRELAGAGALLPRKTSSFGPKPVAGLALRVLEGT